MDERADVRQIINYLLGELSDDAQEGVEERLLTDNEYYDLLLATEDDLIDAYLSGAIIGRERERFEAHFLRHPERREKLRFAAAFRDYVSTRAAEIPREAADIRTLPGRRKPQASFPVVWLAAAAVIIIAVGLASWRIFSHEPGAGSAITALNNAYREQRPVESRISSLDYAPFSLTRGGDGKSDSVARDRAQALIHEEAAEHPGARSYHDLGRLYLARHEFDKAIEQFDKALRLDDKDAALHSDLGAAYMERAIAGGGEPNPGDLAKSLEYLDRAIRLDDSLLAAYFNRALCLQRMNALTPAIQAWEDYLKKDSDSDWAKEAGRKLRLLRDQGTANKTPGEVRQNFPATFRHVNEA
ncbi:MAG: tetratricopeptide repeat protein [Blastocatellia bacterium]